MSSCSGANSSPRKRGRPPNKKTGRKEASLIKRLRETFGITRDIKIELKRCDGDPAPAQLNCTRSIDLPPPILEVNGVVPSPSSSLASYPPLLLREEVNRTIRPKLKSKSKKLEDQTMAPGEISSPRSSKRLQNGASHSSNGGQVGVEIGNSSPPSSGTRQPEKKLSRYPSRRLRSARSDSNSQDDTSTGLPEEAEEKSKSIESLAISKARKIKKKIKESQLPSISETPPPSEAEAQVRPRKKKRRVPAFLRSRSNSKEDSDIMEVDNEPLTPLPTAAVSNGCQSENEILESSPPSSPPSAKVQSKPKRKRTTKSRSAILSDHDEVSIPEGPSTAPLSSNENGGGQVDKMLESPPRVTTPPPQVSPKRGRGRPPKSASASPHSDGKIKTLREQSTATTSPPIAGPSTRKRTRKANISPEQRGEPVSLSKTISIEGDPPTELEISEEVVNTTVIVTILSPSCSASQSVPSLDGTATSPLPPSPELEDRLPSQVIRIRTPSPSKEPVLLGNDTDKPSESLGNSRRDIDSVVVTNGSLLPQIDESDEGTDDDLGDFEDQIRFKMKPISVKAKPNTLSSQTKSSSCLPQPSTSGAPSKRDVPVILTSPPPPVPPLQNNVGLTQPPRQPSIPLLQNVLPQVPLCPPRAGGDKGIHESTDEDDGGSPNLEIAQVQSVAQKFFLLSTFSTPSASVAYYCCVMWDSKILNELQCHEDSRHQLYTSNSIVKLFSESLKSEGHSFPGVSLMDWKRKFILLDIITGVFSKCGMFTSLRVQEKASIDTVKDLRDRPPKWDLVIPPECLNLGEEMVRMHRSGVKTTVVIWGAHVCKYPSRWNGLEGEVFLAPARTDSEALSVIIFHHEVLPHERFRLIQEPHPASELWANFQNPQFNHRLLSKAVLVHMESPTHFTLHAEKLRIPRDYKKATINSANMVEGVEEEEDCEEEVTEFPEFDSCDEEEFEMEEDDEFSLYPEHPDADVDEWDDLESASCMGVGSAGENLSSPDVQASVSQDMVEVAARIFRRSRSIPALPTSPPGGNAYNSPPGRMERRSAEGAAGSGGDKGGAGAGAEVVEPNKCRVVSDSQKKFLLTQELVETDDEDQVDHGNGRDPNELEQTVLTCEEDFVTGDEGASPSTKSPAGTKVCNGYGPPPPKKKTNLSQNGKGTSKDKDSDKSVNGTENPPPSNTEHSEYNFSALLQEF